MKSILVYGATSSIVHQTCRSFIDQFKEEGVAFYLVARNPNKLSSIKQDLLTLGAKEAYETTCDLAKTEEHPKIFNEATNKLKKIDIAYIGHGSLGNETAAQISYEEAQKILNDNFLSVISILTNLTPFFEKQGHGTIAVITSVAGDRGRASNYVYGCAKGALSIFLSGLQARFSRSSVKVQNFKLGFVDTPLTAHYKKGPLWASPEKIGKQIAKHIAAQKCDNIYLPGFWRFIMLIIKHIPQPIFKKLKF